MRASFIVFAIACGCSSTKSSDPIVDSSSSSDAIEETAEETGEDTFDSNVEEVFDPDAPVAPKRPTIVGLYKMAGALHVAWKLNDTGITSEELWRNKDGGEFACEYTFPDARNNYHDGEATGTATYCFKVRTIRDGLMSEFSPEKCGTP